MAFPGTPLRWMAELALGADLTADPTNWTWTDATPYIQGIPAQIGRGRANSFTSAPPASLALSAINTDGRWVERNPVGAWYGQIGRGVPIRFLAAGADLSPQADTFTRTTSSSWGTAETGGAWTTTGGAAADYSTVATFARMALTSATVRRHAVLASTYVGFDQRARVRTNVVAAGGGIEVGFLARYTSTTDHIRPQLVLNTDQSVTAQIVSRDAGTDTVLATGTVAGLTHAANGWIQIRAQTTTSTGRTMRVKAWLDGTAEPPTWTVQVPPQTQTAAAQMGLAAMRLTGNTNSTLTVDFDDYSYLDGMIRRTTCSIASLPRRWADHSATVLYAPITAYGPTQRLQQPGTPRSAIKAGVLTASLTPRQYWPVEDKSGSQTIASALPGFPPIYVEGQESLGTGAAPGSDALMVATNAGRIWGRVPTYTGTDWTVMWLITVPAATAAGQALMQWSTGSMVWQLVLTPSGGVDTISLQAYNSAGVEQLADAGVPFTGEPYGTQQWCEVSAQQVGGDIHWTYFVWGAKSGNAGTKVGATAGTVTQVQFGSGAGADQLAGSVIGHISVWDNAFISLGTQAQVGYAYETTTARWGRIGRQEGVFVRATGTAPAGMPLTVMGAPATAPLLQQMTDVETTEQGMLYDDFDGYVALQPRYDRYNAAVAMTLDVSQAKVGWPFETDNDDQLLRNDVTVTRTGGSLYRAQDTTSNQSVTLRGHIGPPVTSNLAYDSDLFYDAWWRVGQGTVDEDRYTTITLDLTKNPDLIAAWLQCNIGSRIQITNTAALYTPDTVDLFIEGYRETISNVEWKVTLYTSSARVWNVFMIGGSGNLGRLDSGTSTLHSGVTSAATSLSVDVVGPLWITGATSTDIEIAGERMTITNITGSSSPQTFTVTRSVNGVSKAQAANAPLKLWRAGGLAL